MTRLRDWKICFLQFLLLVLWGCNQKPALPISQQIQGGWLNYKRDIKYLSFSGDSVEFGDGLFCRGDSSEITGIAGYSEYRGHFASFRVKKDSIFYRDPCFGKWRVLGNIKLLRNDSLVLIMPEPQPWDCTLTKRVIFTREKVKPTPAPNFDKLIFLETGWAFSPITNEISIDKQGNVFLTGGTWHHKPDFYYAKIDTGYVNYLFKKFQQAEILSLPDKLDDGVIDGWHTYTTVVKDGKMVNSVKHHHGSSSNYYPGMDSFSLKIETNLPLAYKAVKYLPVKLENEKKLKLQPSALPVTELSSLLFFDGKKFMKLNHAEAFYFWTELQKAKPTANAFNPVYRLLCWERFYSIEKEQGKHPAPPLYEIATDGRYFKFPDKNGKPQIFDLGYDFLQRNGLESRFKSADSCDLAKIQGRAKGIF